MKKICPFHRYDILNITQWLNEQDSYGWKLQSWGLLFVEFEESDGPGYQYQIDADNWESGPNEERRAELENLGWEYVETISSTKLHIYRSQDRKASITRTAEFCSYTCKKLRNEMINSAVGALISVAAVLLIPLSKLPILLVELTQSPKITLPVYVIWLCVLIGQFIDGFRYSHRLYKILNKKCSVTSMIYTEGEYQGNRFRFPLKLLQWIFLIVVLIFLLFVENEGDFKNLTETGISAKYMDLETFQEEDFYFSNYSWGSHPEINHANCIKFDDGAFVEQSYGVSQYGKRRTGKTEDLEGYYWMNVSEKLTDRLFSQIIERYTTYAEYYGHGILNQRKYDTREQWSITKVENEYFTELLTAQRNMNAENEWLIFARKGNNIVYLKYQGGASVELLIEKLTEII